MATAIKKAKNIEVAGQNKYNNDYWEVTWDDYKKDKVFDLGHYEIICEAIAKNLNVEIEKEKKGQFWNIKSLKLVGGLVKEIEKAGGKIESVINKNFEEIKQKSIERQKALEIAEKWCEEVISTGTPVKTAEVISIAKVFEKYLETGE
jgi:hypothetical protein